jgi:hypothetical protein
MAVLKFGFSYFMLIICQRHFLSLICTFGMQNVAIFLFVKHQHVLLHRFLDIKMERLGLLEFAMEVVVLLPLLWNSCNHHYLHVPRCEVGASKNSTKLNCKVQ